MTTKASYPHGTFNWVDLLSHDSDSAAVFYSELFGWTAKKQDTQGGRPYTMFFLGEHEVAGMGQMPDDMKGAGIPPLWNSYVSVDDVDAVVAKVTEHGGTVTMPKMKLLDAGSMAVCRDPEGAAFSVWQADQHIGSTLVNEPGSFCWNELAHRNEETLAFYQAVFGWTLTRDVGPMKYTHINNAGDLNAGVIKMNKEWGEMPAHWMVYFAVEDCQASCVRVKELGGAVCVPPTEIPPGTFAVVNDPHGGTFTMLQLKPQGMTQY